MLIDNVMEFEVDGRFFYLKKTQLFKYKGNYKSPGFIFIMIILFLFIFACVVYYCYDYSYFEQEDLLDFLKKEIIKVYFPYDQIDFGDNDKNIENLIPHYNPDNKRRKDIKHMFDNYKFNEKTKEETNNTEINNNQHHEYGTSSNFNLNENVLKLSDNVSEKNSNPPKKKFFDYKQNEEDNNSNDNGLYEENNKKISKKNIRSIYANKNNADIN
jgi:hypothetical protein